MMIKKRGKKRGEAEPTYKLVGAILIILVIVIVVIALAMQGKSGALGKLINLLPDFLKSNRTAPQHVQCPAGFVEVGYIDKSQYINLNGKKTNFYIDNGKIMVDIPYKYDYGEDQLLGYVDGGIISIDFPENLDQKEIEYRSLFPEEKDRRLLLGSNIFEGTICLGNPIYGKFVETDKCTLTCNILNGVCSSGSVDGKAAFKKLDCANGEICYVQDNEKILDSENIHIKKDSYFESLIALDGIPGKTLNEIFNSDKFIVTVPDKIRLVVHMNHAEPFCYSFDVDNEEVELLRGYVDGKDETYSLRSGIISYSGEKILSYAAWNKEKGEKVLVKWKLDSRGLADQYKTTPKIFLESEDGDFSSTDIAYSYQADGWYWSYDWNQWFSVKNSNAFKGDSAIIGADWNYKGSVLWKKNRNKAFIESLAGKSCEEGINILFQKIASDDELLVIGKAKVILHDNEKTENLLSYDSKFKDMICNKLSDSKLGEPKIIDEKKLGWELARIAPGEVLYVMGLKREWDTGPFYNRKESTIVTYDYQIVKDSKTAISIFAHDMENKVWHQIYCNKASINVKPWYSMPINSISDYGLKDTMDKNCMWTF